MAKVINYLKRGVAIVPFVGAIMLSSSGRSLPWTNSIVVEIGTLILSLHYLFSKTNDRSWILELFFLSIGFWLIMIDGSIPKWVAVFLIVLGVGINFLNRLKNYEP